MIEKGSFLGRTLIAERGDIGGSRFVFVKLQGKKNELVFPTFGGQLKNPFKTGGKIFAGDLFEFRTDENGLKPSVYLLKTFVVKSQDETDATKVVLYRDGYKHVPCVGDVLMKAPAVLGGTGDAYAISSVKVDANGNWEVQFGTTLGTLSDGDILVEGKEAGSGKEMLVKNINAVAPCDYDVLYPGNGTTSEVEGEARYYIAPALGGLMYIHKMSPMPQCVLDINRCNVNGWFYVDYLNGAMAAGAASAASIADIEDDIEDLDDRVTALEG